MRTTIRSKALTGGAIALLTLALAGCTDDPAPEPTDLEPAPVGQTSDGGGETPTDQGKDEELASGECAVQEGSDELPTEAPTVDGWQEINSVPVPVSEQYGPYAQEEDLWTCYEHSPLGATFAAHYAYAATGSVAGFADEWVPEGELQAELEAAENEAVEPVNGTVSPAGFRIASYSPDKASVDVAFEYGGAGGTGVASLRWTLIWNGERWQIDPASAAAMEPVILDSLDGYVRWETADG